MLFWKQCIVSHAGSTLTATESQIGVETSVAILKWELGVQGRPGSKFLSKSRKWGEKKLPDTSIFEFLILQHWHNRKIIGNVLFGFFNTNYIVPVSPCMSCWEKVLLKKPWTKRASCSNKYSVGAIMELFVSSLTFEGKLIVGKLSKTTLVLRRCMWSPDTAVSPRLSDLQQPFYHVNFTFVNLKEKMHNYIIEHIHHISRQSAANRGLLLKFGQRS